MLPFPEFEYVAPQSLAEALRALCTPGARLVAGGTDLLPSLKHRLLRPSTLVSLRRVAELKEVTTLQDGTLAIGSGVTLRDVSHLPAVIRDYPGLAAACRTVATPTIQGMATLGGNVMLDTRCLYYNQPEGWRDALGGCLKCDGSVCHVAPKGKGCYAAHSADTVPTLWLLGAQAEVVSPTGVRLLPLPSLYEDDGIRYHSLQPQEILTRILIPPATSPTVHRKLRTRAAIDYALLLVAVARSADGYRAVISATGPRPVEVWGTDPVSLAEEAWRRVQPLSTHSPPAIWRKKMVRVEVRRAAEAL